jgi:peptidyl-prolyl cis-trans isomerase C
VVRKGDLNPEIDRAVFSLPSGSVTDPIATRYGWHVVKVIERLPASFKPFADVKAEILKKEQETQFQKKLADYLEKLKADAVINVSAEAAPYYKAPARAVSPAPGPVKKT